MSDDGAFTPPPSDPTVDIGPSSTEEDEASIVLLLQRRASNPSGPERRTRDALGERYRSRGVLGHGGMGEVRLCRDVYIGRNVAMKLLLPHAVSRADLRARFEREARVQGRLEHPAIVPVYDFGVGSDGAAYFTMKRVHGHTLRQITMGLRAEDPAFEHFTLRRRLEAFKQACLAVAFAHARGVVHRDLKPANVMLGDFGEVYVLDWGIAKVVSENEISPERGDSTDALPEETGSSVLLGTAGYMSPEIVRGENDTLDGRSDIYALGAILFTLLTLSSLHEGSPEEKRAATLAGVDATISGRFAELDVAPELEQAVVKATALRREDRHPSVLELVMVIERYLDGDRDASRRHVLAARHVAAARAAMKREGEGREVLAARSDAIREVSRALALHPTDAHASATMHRLVSDLPAVAPEEVREELDANETSQRRQTQRAGAIIYFIWIVLLCLAGAMGVRSWPAWTCTLVLVTLSAALSLWAGRMHGRDSLVPGVALAFVSFGSIASASMIFGPLLLVPGLAATNTLVFVLHTPRGRVRDLLVLLGLVAFLAPPALEWLGLLAPSLSISPQSISILPRMVGFSSSPSLLLLLLANAALIVAPALLIARVRDEARAAERRVLMHLWQFRQVLPVVATASAPLEAHEDDEPDDS